MVRGGICYEADPVHAKTLIEEMGLHASSKGLDRPAAKDEKYDPGAAEEEQLGAEEARRFRSLAARANYLSQDRPDIQFAAKEVCRRMARPTQGCWDRLKKLARYLVQHPRLVLKFLDTGRLPEVVQVYSDSDWAGCQRTRKSTSGGVVVVNGTAVKSWSYTQSTLTLSSAEAELVAFVKSAAEALGAKSLAADLGLELAVEMFVDASAAIGIANRMGIGRVKHLDVKDLWVQEQLRRKAFRLTKIAGDANPADVGTKPLSIWEMETKLGAVGVHVSRTPGGTGPVTFQSA